MYKFLNSKMNNSYADAKRTSAHFPCNNNVIIKHTILVCFFVVFLFNITLNVLSILIKQALNKYKETLPSIC